MTALGLGLGWGVLGVGLGNGGPRSGENHQLALLSYGVNFGGSRTNR